MSKPAGEHWPSWPAGEEGVLLHRVEVDVPVDDLFKLWWEPESPFTVRAAGPGPRACEEVAGATSSPCLSARGLGKAVPLTERS